MREIDSIIIHCSDSEFGDAAAIDRWHRDRGFDQIGYHYVITNGHRRAHGNFVASDNSIIEPGRPVEKIGAHCKGKNAASIGICLIGRHHFTAWQLFDALPRLLGVLLFNHQLNRDQVWGHRDFNTNKTCPNISTETLRGIARMGIAIRAKEICHEQ